MKQKPTQENQLSHILRLTALVVVVLIIISFIPSWRLGNMEVRRANILGDLVTFEELYRDFKIAKDARLSPDSLASQKPFYFRVGDEGADVSRIHALLHSLALYEKNLPRIPSTSFYSPMTAEAIRFLQRLFDVQQTGEVDAKLYLRMEEELRTRKEEERIISLDTAP